MAVLAVFVLPAEYGFDPLGTGAALGLLGLSEPQRTALASAPAPHRGDAVRFELQPFESVEYKYRLESGAGMVFSWRASGAVVSELHAEPDGAPEGFAESFRKARGSAGHGSYRAPFPGWHGWFWQNRGSEPVTVELEAAGFFSAARSYGAGRVLERAIPPADASGRSPPTASAGSANAMR